MFRDQQSQIRPGALQTPDADIDRTVLETLEPVGVAEQALGQPTAGLTRLGAEGVTSREEGGDAHTLPDRVKLHPSSRGYSPSEVETAPATMPRMIEIDRDKLRQLIADRGTSPRAVSRGVGGNDHLVRDILSGRSRNARADTIAKIADYLEVPSSAFMSGSDAAERAATIAAATLPIRGVVQAGAWLEIDEDQSEPETYPAAADLRFPIAAQWLSVVRGDSMNALERNGQPAAIYDGDMVHCVDVTAIEYSPRDGDIVEVERVRAQGGVREVTLKQVEIIGGVVQLWPRSTNPRWTAPIPYADGDVSDTEVRIRGWVIGSLRRF